MSWVTFFGNKGGLGTELYRQRVEDWADSYGIEFHYKELTDRNRREYSVEVAPTIRYFHPANGPRDQYSGGKAIDRFLKGGPRR